MNWTSFTIDMLETLKSIGGSYGMAIILLTIIVRLALLPLSVSQQRSMKKMQELTPRLKLIQTKYKSEPQVLQKKMMEFYKEHKFNPLGGCFPLLLQMPVFILLYTTLISVPFIQMAGQSSFLFIHRLDSTLQTYAGKIDDGTFNVKENDKFITDKYNIKVVIPNKEIVGQIDDYRNALKHSPVKIKPGDPLIFTLSTDKISFPDQQVNKNDIQSAIVPVLNDNTKEIEQLKFERVPNTTDLTATIKTAVGKTIFNYDVLFLIILFGVTMYLSQKLMTNPAATAAMDPQQKAMQESMSKMMPIMILAMFIIIPIPSGVLLYMVVSNIFQVGQTIAINKYLEYEDAKNKRPKAEEIIDVEAITIEESESTEDTETEITEESNNQNIIETGPNNPQQSRKLRRKKKKAKKFK